MKGSATQQPIAAAALYQDRDASKRRGSLRSFNLSPSAKER
jgi:hypothetical protein